MANAKISNASVFKLGGQYLDVTNILAIPGYGVNAGTGSNENCAISGTQLVSSLESNLYTTTPLPTSKGGIGSTNTTYCSLTANVFGVLPKTNGGSNNIIQVFTWTNGSPVNYGNVPQGTLYYIPCGTLPIVTGKLQ